MSEAAAAQAGTEQGQQAAQPTQQAANQSWHGDVGQEDMTYLQAKGWTGNDAPPKIFQSYRNLEKLFSQVKGDPERVIMMPKDMNNAEEVQAFRSKLGVPQSPADYGLKPAEGDSDPMLESFAKIAHEKGYTKEQAESAVNFLREHSQQLQASQEQAWEAQAKQDLEAFMKESGNALDENKSFARQAREKFPILEEKANELERALGVKGYLDLMVGLGKQVGEHKAVGVGADSYQDNSVTSAIQTLAQFKMDAQKMSILSDNSHPQHQAALAEWNRLHGLIYK